MRFARLTVLATAALLVTAPAHAQRAVQVSPDGSNLLINKPFGGQEWSIVVNFDAQTVAGNVFNFDGSDPQFLYCNILEQPITSPADFANLESVVLDCRAAEGCSSFPCSPASWTELGQVAVIASFFLPPGSPLHCNQVGPPQCAGVCDVVPGAQCVPLGNGCSCVVPQPTPTATATSAPQPTFTPAADPCCKHCTNSLPCGDSCIPFTFICRQPPGCACF